MIVLIHVCWALACAGVLLSGDNPSRLVVVVATLLLLGRTWQRARSRTVAAGRAPVRTVSWDDVLQRTH